MQILYNKKETIATYSLPISTKLNERIFKKQALVRIKLSAHHLRILFLSVVCTRQQNPLSFQLPLMS